MSGFPRASLTSCQRTVTGHVALTSAVPFSLQQTVSPQTVGPNKLPLSLVASVRFFVTAKREVTNTRLQCTGSAGCWCGLAVILTCIRHILYMSWKLKRGKRVEKTASSSWGSVRHSPCFPMSWSNQLVASRPRRQYGRQRVFRALTNALETVRRERSAKHRR